MTVDDRLRDMFAELNALRGENRDLRVGGHGPSDGGSDDWKASVDLQLKQLHDDIRRLTGYMIAGAIAPFLAIIGLYVYAGGRFDQVNAKFDQVEQRIVGVEGKVSTVAVDGARANGKLDLLLERTKERAAP